MTPAKYRAAAKLKTKNKMSLEIRYNHTSKMTADTFAAAMALVRTEAIHTQRSAKAAAELVSIKVDDGTYIYLDQAAADRDDTGAQAFAVICQPE